MHLEITHLIHTPTEGQVYPFSNTYTHTHTHTHTQRERERERERERVVFSR